MLIEGHQVGLELEQKGAAIDGVMLVMGQRLLLEGTYAERTLTLKAEKTEDGSGGPHGSAHAGPIVARMLDDGTLEGELSTTRGRTKWSGERLPKVTDDHWPGDSGAHRPTARYSDPCAELVPSSRS